MKKIFTLLFAVGTISIASAQSRDFGHNKQSYGYSVNNKQNEMQKINREYDFKITAIKMNRHMSSWDKSRQIRDPERQRASEISRCEYSYQKDYHQFNDDRFAKNKSHKW